MRPQVYKVESLAPVTMQRADLHELACAFGESCFAEHGTAPFMWIIAADKRLAWINTPWENEEEKLRSIAGIRALLKALDAHAYVQVAEAWVARLSKEQMEREEAEGGVIAPGNRPESERDDVLMIQSFDRKGGWAMTRYLVTIKRRGLSYLGPRVDVDEFEEGRLSGRMFDLFKSDHAE